MLTKKMKTHARNGFEKRLWIFKKQEVNDTDTLISVQMKKMKTHTGRGFDETNLENYKARSEG